MTKNNNIKKRLPAEWEPQSAIQLTWPHGQTDWASCLDDITKTFVELATVIARFEPVLIVMPDEEHITRFRQQLPEKNILFAICPSNDTWARDHAFITVEEQHGNERKKAFRLLDFQFNGWGEKFPAELDNAINARLYDKELFNGTYENHLDFVLEGGSIESDGKGTVFTTSQCLLAPHRNQPLNRIEIDKQLCERLGAERIVWLEHGNLIGDDTDGHIDTTVRCAPNNTLLYIRCDDAKDEHYEDFLWLEQQLKELRTIDGKPYRLIPLPFPDAIFEEGERLPATYANFLIVNGAVICPTYAQPKKDRMALNAIKQAFPQYEIIGIDARTIVRQHGSIHCLTMQYPEGTIRNIH